MKKSRQVPQQAVAHLLYWIFSNEKSLQIGLQDGAAKEHKVDEFQVFCEVVGQLFGRELYCLNWTRGGGYSTYPWVGRYGAAPYIP